jgi:DNA-binding response OmpR family regulator
MSYQRMGLLRHNSHVFDIGNSMKPTSPRAALHAPRVLLIEDRPDEIRSLLTALRREQFQISIAFDGMQGYGRAVAQQPDIILLDVELGRTDGFAVCRLLKADPATVGIPVIFVTARGALEDRLTGLREGAVDYILKPFESEEVVARMRNHLRSRFVPEAFENIAKPSTNAAIVNATDNSDQFLVTAAARHVQVNLARLPPLAELARRVGTHKKRLTKAFQGQKGQSVFEYVRQERLLLARRLLTQTPLTVAEIAEEAGFSSAANFATAFKAAGGSSPTAYRQQKTVSDAS